MTDAVATAAGAVAVRAHGARDWRVLRLFNLYRIIVAGLFAMFGALARIPPDFADLNQPLFAGAAYVYLVLAIMGHVAISSRTSKVPVLVNTLVVIDIVAITAMMHATGGVAGGFGILLVVSIAGACLLATPRAAISLAALATLAILGQSVSGVLALEYTNAVYPPAGLLGAACFATAVLGSLLAEQARRSEALAAERAVDIQNLSQLNEQVVQRMRSGILAIDRHRNIVLANEAAANLLRRAPATLRGPLLELEPKLDEALTTWQARNENVKTPTPIGPEAIDAIVSFSNLGGAGYGGTLIFLEDAAETRQRAQQLKLASLGRLTASIAHEIRNPLGAISHASQLLSESPDINDQDRRLTRIVTDHSTRMNTIIENVMMIGRRETAIAEFFELRPWLEGFRHELLERRGLAAGDVRCELPDAPIQIRMDRSQLNQVLWNLCENALRYSRESPLLDLRGGVARGTERPFVEVRDSGPGMTEVAAEQVFEPFYTGEESGTGLGLYIASELCEANQAKLTLVSHGPDGCVFRILFAHPDRQQLTE